MFYFLRKSYAKATQIWNDYEDDMKEWAKEDPESYALSCYYSHLFQGGGSSG